MVTITGELAGSLFVSSRTKKTLRTKKEFRIQQTAEQLAATNVGRFDKLYLPVMTLLPSGVTATTTTELKPIASPTTAIILVS